MLSRLKGLAPKPGDPSLVPRTRKVEGENQLLKLSFNITHLYTHAQTLTLTLTFTHTHTYRQTYSHTLHSIMINLNEQMSHSYQY